MKKYIFLFLGSPFVLAAQSLYNPQTLYDQPGGLFDEDSLRVMDLGEFWETETGLPIPLGGIVVRRELPSFEQKKIERVLRKSVEYAFENPTSSATFVKCHSHAMEKEVVDAHIALYVNDYSISLGEQGRKAVKLFFKKSGHSFDNILFA